MSRASAETRMATKRRRRKRVWSLCTCINSKPCYGSFVLVSQANLTSTPACVTALWIYAAPANISLQPPIPCLLPLFPFPQSFAVSDPLQVKSVILVFVLFAKTKDWVITSSRSLGYTCLKRYLKNPIKMIYSII